MKTKIATGLALISFCLPLFAAEVVAKVTKITEAPSKSLVTIELHNGHPKGLKSYKAMLVLKDPTGKVVDVQSRWLLGGGSQPEKETIIPANAKREVNIPLTSQRPFKQIEIVPSRIILEDGSVITPPSKPPTP